MSDIRTQKKENMHVDLAERPIMDGISKDIVYLFFGLSYVQQAEILSSLQLLREEYEGKRYIDVIDLILNDAENAGCLEKFYAMIKRKCV